jgi:uncharacterized metal-binding protein
MTYVHNIGALDRLGRLIVGLLLLAAGLFGALATSWQIAALAGAILLLTTAAVGFCPGYVPFGICTRRRRFDEPSRTNMNPATPTFAIEVETTPALCPVGERYAAEQMRNRTTPVLSCEGPCIRGEIARQAAHMIGRQSGFARACQGEAVAVPDSAMARWVREAEKVLVLDGCFLHCQGRLMRRMLRPDQLLEIDALPLYRRYTDLFDIDSVAEAERLAVARQVAERVLAKVTMRTGISVY